MPGEGDYELILYRGVYAAKFYRDGKRVRQSLGTPDPELARKKLAVLVEMEKRHASEGTWDVARIWEAYREELGERPTRRTMGYSSKAVLPHFGHLLPAQIDREICNAYAKKRLAAGKSHGTVWTELTHLRAALRWAEKSRLIDRAPAIWQVRKPKPRHDFLTKEEVAQLLSCCPMPHLRLFIILAVTTAGRAAAILELTWDRVDLDRGIIHLENPERKIAGKGRATVPINGTARAALQEMKQGAMSPYVVEWQGQRIKTVESGLGSAAKRAGLKHVHPHMLRHTAAVWMAEGGIPMTEISQYLGHRDSRVTERVYARYSPSYLRNAAGALEMEIYEVVTPGSRAPGRQNGAANDDRSVRKIAGEGQ